MEPYNTPQYEQRYQKRRSPFASLIVGIVSGFIGAGLFSYLLINGKFNDFFAFEEKEDTPQAVADAIEPTERIIIEESEVTEVVKTANASVVSIIVSQELTQQQQNAQQFGNGFFFNDPLFNQFFGQQQQAPEENSQHPEHQTVEVQEGSGFVVTEDGLILTNKHVVNIEDAEYTVVFEDGTTYEAKVLARDNVTDLAILKIEAIGLKALELGDSDSVIAGQTAIAIGNTLGEYANTVTKGIISGVSRSVKGLGAEYTDLIQTDASINQGNSGGPLLNIAGQVIGINTVVDRGGEGIGFAIPMNEAKIAIESVKKDGRIIRPGLGIRYIQVTPEIAKANNLLYEYGAYIRGGSGQPGVIAGSAAENAGLKEGDIILEVEGVQVDEDHELVNLITEYKVGDIVRMKVLQSGEEKEVQVTLKELPQE